MLTRRSIAAVVVLGLLLSAMLVMQSTGAGFVATTNNTGNSATADKLNPATNPSAVRGCTAVPSNRWIDLSWTASTSGIVNRYRIFRSVSGGAFSSLTTVTGTSYQDSGLSIATQYSYYIVAERSGTTWVSTNSSTVSQTTHAIGCT